MTIPSRFLAHFGRLAASAVVAGTTCIGAANAAFIDLPTIAYGGIGTSTNFSLPVSISQYNPAAHGGAALTGIRFMLSSFATTGAGSVTCSTPPEGIGGPCAGTIASQIIQTLNLTFGGGPTTTLLSNFNYSLTLGQSATIPSGALTGSNSTQFMTGDMNFLTPFYIGAFSGTGSVASTVGGNGTVTAIASNGFVVQGNPIVGYGNLDVRYFNSTDAPEPATLAVLGTGALGLIIARRRRSRR